MEASVLSNSTCWRLGCASNGDACTLLACPTSYGQLLTNQPHQNNTCIKVLFKPSGFCSYACKVLWTLSTLTSQNKNGGVSKGTFVNFVWGKIFLNYHISAKKASEELKPTDMVTYWFELITCFLCWDLIAQIFFLNGHPCKIYESPYTYSAIFVLWRQCGYGPLYVDKSCSYH